MAVAERVPASASAPASTSALHIPLAPHPAPFSQDELRELVAFFAAAFAPERAESAFFELCHLVSVPSPLTQNSVAAMLYVARPPPPLLGRYFGIQDAVFGYALDAFLGLCIDMCDQSSSSAESVLQTTMRVFFERVYLPTDDAALEHVTTGVMTAFRDRGLLTAATASGCESVLAAAITRALSSYTVYVTGPDDSDSNLAHVLAYARPSDIAALYHTMLIDPRNKAN